MAILTDKLGYAEGVLSEGNLTRSRENVIIISGQNLQAMSVVGKITASGKYTALTAGAVDGSQTAAGVLLQAVDASAADAKGVIIARDAEIGSWALKFGAGEDAGEQAAHIVTLRSLGIIIRDSV